MMIASRQRHGGAALLLLMLVVLVASASVLIVNLDRNELRTRAFTDTRAALATAKTALIEYATLNPALNPGEAISLPCPDLDAGGAFVEGEAHTAACGGGGVSMMGRLPWRTLGTPALRDAAGECLWYVVSGSYKQAGAATATLINADSNGQLQFADLESGSVVQGLLPADRVVAMVLAPMRPVTGQARPAASAGAQCSPGFNAARFLEADSISGISNAAVSGSPDTIDVLGAFASVNDAHNDRIVTITREEIEAALYGQAGFLAEMRSLGTAAAKCVAYYAASNPGGGTDKRLPWPAPVALADYRVDSAYDDTASGFLSGRLPDVVDDSNSATGNATARVISDCDPVNVPEWSSLQLSRWQNWKDHFFYAVADSHAPPAAVPSACAGCLTVNGGGQYVAVLMFSNVRLSALSQVRNAPPVDIDTRDDAANYLEASNAVNVPGSGAGVDYTSQPASALFNDLLFCIDDNLVVSEC